MRDSVRNAIGETVRDMIRSGLKPSFTKKEPDSLGVEVQDTRMAKEQTTDELRRQSARELNKEIIRHF